jgi:hypothetical protein
MLKTSARSGTLVLVAVAALLVSAFAAVPAAQASTIYACVSKSGTAHVFTKKPKKCKSKKEKLVSWNTAGPAGQNGANGSNGTNGTNGKEGVAGQPQKAAAFNKTIASAGSSVSLFTLGEVSVKLSCGNFIVNIATLEGSAPTGSLAETGMVVTNSSNETPEISQTLVREAALVPAFGAFLSLTTNTKGTLTNKAHVNGSIVTPTATVLIDAYLEVGPEPKACVAKGSAFTIPL